jgi:hypothetical protein
MYFLFKTFNSDQLHHAYLFFLITLERNEMITKNALTNESDNNDHDAG